MEVLKNMPKYVFVTGGVVSSLGKGITAASLGVLLKRRGFRVSIIKMDPYINVDAGTMNPFQHGEAFVTDDAAAFLERDFDAVLLATYCPAHAGDAAGHVRSRSRR